MLRRNLFWMQKQCLLSGIYNRNNNKMFYMATRKSAHLKIAKLIETNDWITLNNVSQALSDRQTEQITIGMFWCERAHFHSVREPQLRAIHIHTQTHLLTKNISLSFNLIIPNKWKWTQYRRNITVHNTTNENETFHIY